MDSGSEGINVYADAKSEYTRQLSQYCLNAYLRYFLNLFDETKNELEPRKILITFQGALKNISDWSFETVQKETAKLLKDINCDYFEDLLSAVFVAHTKVLSAIRLSTKQKKLQITIPKVEHFLHHTLIECARIIWSNVFLFSPAGSPIERQKNLRSTEQLIQDGILQSIRSMLPVKNILKEYLKDDGDDEEVAEEKVEVAEEKLDIKEEVAEEKEEELKIQPIEEKKTELKIQPIEEEKKQPKTQPIEEEEVVPQKKSKQNDSSPVVPTIEIDTEPSVQFSNVNTVFDYENTSTNDEDEDEDEDSLIKVLDMEGVELSEFEELEKTSPIEFEEL